MGVVRQERADARQPHPFVVRAVVPRQDQTSESGERRVTQEITDGVLDAEAAALTCMHVGVPAPGRHC
jgi:hypothetical protein